MDPSMLEDFIEEYKVIEELAKKVIEEFLLTDGYNISPRMYDYLGELMDALGMEYE